MRSNLVVIFALVAASLVIDGSPASAQLAPTGAHYAARASDTGHSSVSGTGAYATSVPLDLPPARGGIPIPVALTTSGSGVGSGGLGWDVPLWYVRRNATVARRRPSFTGNGGVLQPREEIIVSLGGRTVQMVRRQPGVDIWVARQDAPDLELHKETGNTWRLLDGRGHQFLFTQQPVSDLWLLKSVVAARYGNRVDLEYEVTPRSFAPGFDAPGPRGSGTSIDLVAVRYNAHPNDATCLREEIQLGYGALSSKPLSLSLLGSQSIVRLRTLDQIKVSSRESCGSAPKTQRTYKLKYLAGNDVDTRLPQLASVDMTGREGTPEASMSLPVVAYRYGAATVAAMTERILRYERGPAINLPVDLGLASPIASTVYDSGAGSPDGGKTYVTWQNLIDVTGDGRPDLVYKKNGQLWIAVNRPAGGSATTFATPVQLSDATYSGRPLASHASEKLRYDFAFQNQDHVWQQTIDVNGDGRLDIIDASEEAGRWVFYLNTPGQATNVPVKWVRRSIPIGTLRAVLEQHDYEIEGDYLPLVRRSTGYDILRNECWKWNPSQQKYEWYEQGYFLGVCWILESDEAQSAQKTFTEWELKDINGDGYPDFIFTSSPTRFDRTAPIPSEVQPPTYLYDRFLRRFEPDATSVVSVKVAFNVAGIRLDSTYPFSTPSVLANDGSAIESWGDESGRQYQGCGIEDVNGDGIADRILQREVRLGTGTGEPFDSSPVRIYLPDAIRHHNGYQAACPPGGVINYSANQVTALRDLTGDHIPDFIDENGRVWLGTGTEFRSPIALDDAMATGGFVKSSSIEHCGGNYSNTSGGLYDIDGDGKPEVIRKASGTSQFDVYYLVGDLPGLGNPQAGRLSSIDNRYGAITTVTYRSAKEDPSTAHQVPFPEIVVTSVETVGTYGLGGTLSAVRYAYGDAVMFFDPFVDAFTMRAYGRSIEVHGTGREAGEADFAIVRETYGLASFNSSMGDDERFARYQRVGRIRETHVLGHGVPRDPWTLLATFDPVLDSRRMAGVHDEWTSKYVPLPQQQFTNPLDCIDIVDPYEWALTVGYGRLVCGAAGFGYRRSSESWLGTQPPPSSASNVQTRFEVTAVDNRGNVVSTKNQNDLFVSDDDLCVNMRYAEPTTQTRIFSALSERVVTDCREVEGRTLSIDRWEYDALPVGSVGLGRATSHTVEPHATNDGEALTTIRDFEAGYDEVGNLKFFVTARSEDGAVRALKIWYDEFGLVPVSSTLDASGLPPLGTSIGRDPLTLEATSQQDANGTVWGNAVDGFGRVARTTVQPPGGTVGVVSTTTYGGFIGSDPNGRTVNTKSFRDPVKLCEVNTATGPETVTRLDELGRPRRVERLLGADYGKESLVVLSRVYDGLGRVSFDADPHPASAERVYGTTYHFATDGTLTCSIRGTGPQPLTSTSDLAREILPTCFARTFANHAVQYSVNRPDSLTPGSPQLGTTYRDTATAIGRVTTRETLKGSTRLELATFEYDPLGQLVAMTRFGDPQSFLDAVYQTLRLDSNGRTLSAKESSNAPRSFAYSSWGELLGVEWTDTTFVPAVAMRLDRSYDALGRITESWETRGGTEVADSTYLWTYDNPDGTPLTDVTFTAGRLTKTSSRIGDMHLSYDAFGRVNARAFVVGKQTDRYFERSALHFDGSIATLEFKLPDTNYKAESYTYGYDSASNLRTVVEDASGSPLYSAITIDALQRVRSATYGQNTTYRADYAETGRRLPIEYEIRLPDKTRRRVAFTGYDGLGRERSREESADAAGATTAHGYDALGRLTATMSGVGGGSSSSFTYDPLGNLRSLVEAVSGDKANLTFSSVDRDRVCRIDYGPTVTGPCNVQYDGSGNTVSQPTRSGVNRRLSFYPSGAIQEITQGTTTAQFRYDGSGEISELDVYGAFLQDARRDRRYGLFERREVNNASIIVRDIPGLGGIVASRRGANGPWIFPFAEERGTRFATDDAAFVQDVSYLPFGKATSKGAKPGDHEYTNRQWNGGDALVDLGIVNVGARLYDPAIGRFLSRDPLLVPRTASTTNPYAFALNDPINRSDPTGLDPDPYGLGICATSGSGACGNSPSDDGALVAGAIGLAQFGYSFFLGGGSTQGTGAHRLPDSEFILDGLGAAEDSFVEQINNYRGDDNYDPNDFTYAGPPIVGWAYGDPTGDFDAGLPPYRVWARMFFELLMGGVVPEATAVRATIYPSSRLLTSALRVGEELAEVGVTRVASVASAVDTAAASTFRDAAGRLRNANGTFAFDGGRKTVTAVGTHGNTAGSQQAFLYARYDAREVFEKWGITQDLAKRYSKRELNGGDLVPVHSGPRRTILKIERYLVETNPGPLNRERWAGKLSRGK